jgi:hypothetical protein
MSEHTLVMRPLGSGDWAKLPDLLERVWGKKTEEAYWTWKYLDPPFATKGFVTEREDGEIVAFSGFWLRELAIGGTTYPAYQMADVMADPNYRGGLAFRFILNHVKDLLRNEKIIAYGFTNPVSHKLFYKIFRDILLIDTEHPVYALILDPGDLLNTSDFVKTALGSVARGLAKTRLGLTGSHNFRVEEADVIPEEVNRLWAEVCQEYHLIFKRDADYLNWRFRHVPQGSCQIWLAEDGQGLAGYLVTALARRPDKTKGFIMDWLVSPQRPEVFKALLDKALKWFLQEKVNVVETWFLNLDDHVGKTLQYRMFIKGRRNRSFLLAGIHPALIPRDMVTAENALVTVGDSDCVVT